MGVLDRVKPDLVLLDVKLLGRDSLRRGILCFLQLDGAVEVLLGYFLLVRNRLSALQIFILKREDLGLIADTTVERLELSISTHFVKLSELELLGFFLL